MLLYGYEQKARAGAPVLTLLQSSNGGAMEGHPWHLQSPMLFPAFSQQCFALSFPGKALAGEVKIQPNRCRKKGRTVGDDEGGYENGKQPNGVPGFQLEPSHFAEGIKPAWK